MIDPILAIEKIKNALKAEIDSGRLNGTYSESDKTISLYIYKTETETDPLLSFRVTDHRPIMQKYIRPGAPRPSTQDNTNMSVEFYIPRYEPDGTKKQNKFRNNVVSPITIEKVKPFSISSFNYDSRILEQGDDDCILKSIIDWLHNSRGNYPYKDPFENTPKAANVLTKTAKVKISSGEGGVPVTEIVHNNKVKLTESQLRRIIQESLIESLGILEEGKLGRALGTAALGAGLMFGHPQQANAQLNVKHTIQDAPKVLVNVPMDNKSIEVHGDLYYLKMISTNRFDDRALCLTLGRSVEQCLQTLNDLKGLVDNKTAMVEVGDNKFGDLTIEYGSVGIGERGLWFSQRGCAGKSFMHRGTIDKMIAKLQESEPTTYNVQSEDYFDDWQPKRSHDLGEPVLGKKRRNQ